MILVCFVLPFILFANANEEGNKYYRAEKYPEALQKYAEAEQQYEENPKITTNFGNALYKDQKYESSIQEYEKALNYTDDKNFKSDIYFNMGNASLKAGDMAKALDYYKQSMRLNPDNMDAKYNFFLLREWIQPQQEQQQQQQSCNRDQKCGQEEKRTEDEMNRYLESLKEEEMKRRIDENKEDITAQDGKPQKPLKHW